MKIKQLISYLESIAPPGLQESYDNSGLLIGDPDETLKGVLICLDSTEEVVAEAINLGCNLILAHHPIIFRGLKRLNGRTYVERVVMDAIKNEVAIYAIHTNLDNVYRQGVNAKIAEKLGLINTRILSPKSDLKKLVTNIPLARLKDTRTALLAAGADRVYDFTIPGMAVQRKDSLLETKKMYQKLEVVFSSTIKENIVGALQKKHPSTLPDYEIFSIDNENLEVGSGLIGELERPMEEVLFLKFLKKTMQTACIRHTRFLGKPVSKVALCGGSGGFLLKQSIAQKADIFITADYKYHEFFDADGKIIIADIGHYESEQFTIELLHGLICQKFSNFAAHLTKVNTNPVNYYF